MLSVADGVGIVTENLFSGRFRYVDELRRMGADIRTEGHHAVVRGVRRLSGAPVRAPDLRAGAALVLAGMTAEGETVVSDAEHIDRGYEDLAGDAQLAGRGRHPRLTRADPPTLRATVMTPALTSPSEPSLRPSAGPAAGPVRRARAVGPRRVTDPGTLFEAAAGGDRVALARLLTLVESGGTAGRAVAALAYRSPGEARTVGITGPPGAGKSTLVDRLIATARAAGRGATRRAGGRPVVAVHRRCHPR